MDGSLIFEAVTLVAESTHFSWSNDSNIVRSGLSAVFDVLGGPVSADGVKSWSYFDKLTLTPA